MKTPSDILHLALAAAACLLSGSLTSTAAPATPADIPAFARLIDAVAQGQDKLRLFIDGESMNPDGYILGDVTGGIGLKPGPHEFTLKRPGVSDGVTRITLAAGHTITLIAFAEQTRVLGHTYSPTPANGTRHQTLRHLCLRLTYP